MLDDDFRTFTPDVAAAWENLEPTLEMFELYYGSKALVLAHGTPVGKVVMDTYGAATLQGSPSGAIIDAAEATDMLMDDSSAPLAGGKLILTQGKSFLGTPSQRTLNASFWAGTTGFSDSVTGLADVSAMSFRVVPVDGKASYEIELSVPAGRQLVLVVGDLFGNATAWTTKVTITALSDSSSVRVTLAGMYG